MQVFDAADRLNALHARLVRNLISLSTLTGRNICPVFTCLNPAALLSDWSEWTDMPPISIQFPSPTQETVIALVSRAMGPHPQLKAFLTQIWGLFGGVCGPDLREFTYLAATLFPTYVSCGGTSAAFKAAVSIARANVFTHDVRVDAIESSSAAKASAKAPPAASSSTGAPLGADSGVLSAPSVASRGVELELPYLSKFMLLAAYCASYNPVESDKVHFTRMSGGRGKKRRRAGAVATTSGAGSGAKETASKKRRNVEHGHAEPKPFTLERLLSIVNSLVTATDGPLPPSDIASADMMCEVRGSKCMVMPVICI